MDSPTKNRRSLLRDTEGHAMTEAVIMLPVFIIIWGFIVWASQVYENQLDLVAVTRDHAWQHAMNDCHGAVPPGTSFRPASDASIPGLSGLSSTLDGLINMIPIFEEYWPGLSFDEDEYQREGNVPAPEVTGADDQRTVHRVVLLCNEDQETPDLEEMSNGALGVFW
ncbi:MAG: hypothetical protein DRJ42_21395 [Deltaproteobacteria bacterium]|nr:MAG: hypothetical protein DRJ42_21395 [Deltaproteobacteria bacterium]